MRGLHGNLPSHGSGHDELVLYLLGGLSNRLWRVFLRNPLKHALDLQVETVLSVTDKKKSIKPEHVSLLALR